MMCESFHRFYKSTAITSFYVIAYIKTISKKVILMDGEQLASYMIEYGLGVSMFATFDISQRLRLLMAGNDAV
jgi:restriction endonuclease Mrr